MALQSTVDGLRPQGPVEAVRNGVVLAVVALYLVFNYGFMQVRIPPVAGGGVPVGEIVLIAALATINYTTTLGRLAATISLTPLILWWAYGLLRAFVDFRAHGFWALRDAVHVIESLYLIVGFAVVSRPALLERLFASLPWLLGLIVIYGFLAPVKDVAWAMSPTITAGNGLEVPILGTYANTGLMIIVVAGYLLVFRGNRPESLAAALLLMAFSLFIFQGRTLYVACFAMFGLVVIYRRDHIGTAALAVASVVLLATAMPVLGIGITGRLGETMSLTFLTEHFLATFGIGSEQTSVVTSAAAGVGQRLTWWKSIFERLTDSPFSLLFGLGYGVTLTDIGVGAGAPVREPHNSYVSIAARLGLIGFVAWAAMLAVMLGAWRRAMSICRQQGWGLGQARLLVLMLFFVSVWVLSMSQDGFEKPYNTIPYYFLWGVVLRITYALERGEIGPESEQGPSSQTGLPST